MNEFLEDYTGFADLALHLLAHGGGVNTRGSAVDQALPASGQDSPSMEIRLATNVDTFYGWLVSQAALFFSSLETDALGLLNPQFRLDPPTGRIEGAWKSIAALFDGYYRHCDAWRELVLPIVFLTATVSPQDSGVVVKLRRHDARFRVPFLRLLARALREFPVDRTSEELAARFTTWAGEVQRVAPVWTSGTWIADARRGREALIPPEWGSMPVRVHLIAAPVEYVDWLRDQASSSGVLSGFQSWGLPDGTVHVKSAGSRESERSATRLSVERVREEETGILVTARPETEMAANLSDLDRIMRASMSEFAGNLLPPGVGVGHVEPATRAANDVPPSPAMEALPPKKRKRSSEDLWVDARRYAELYQEHPQWSQGELAKELGGLHWKLRYQKLRHRVNYVITKLRSLYGDDWQGVVLQNEYPPDAD